MSVDRNTLHTASSLIMRDDEGYFVHDGLSDIVGSTGVYGLDNPRYKAIRPLIGYVRHDERNLLTIVSRLMWQKELWVAGQLADPAWMIYAALDIDLFHVELRSLLDYLAKVMALASDYPSVQQKSFEKLRNWLAKADNNAERFGIDLSEVVLGCTWFNQLRSVRDMAIHRGGFAMLFHVPGRALFQFYDEYYKPSVNLPEIMWNQHVVDLELYCGMYIAYLLCLLEDVSRVLSKRIDLPKVGQDSRLYHPVLGWVEERIRDTLRRSGPEIV